MKLSPYFLSQFRLGTYLPLQVDMREKKTIELHLPFINFRAANVNFLFPGEMQNFVGEKKYT
jgi:hypothetical protein